MRITYRATGNKAYWLNRWEQIPVDNPMDNLDIYPLKYSEMIIKNKDALILEAGCGNGRILRYYHNRGYRIAGFDFINIAVKKLLKEDPSLDITVDDITQLKYENCTFDYILAFGLYHNLENNLDNAIMETYRVMKEGGIVCASFRADNLQNRLNDWLASKKFKDKKNLVFHKMNLKKREFELLFSKVGFEVMQIFPVENMPFLYKFRLFRSKSHKVFNENMARKEGYKLNLIGNIIQQILMTFFSNQFCNIYVLIAKK